MVGQKAPPGKVWRLFVSYEARIWVLLVVACLIVYFPALHGDFIWDDDAYVSENATLLDVRGLWSNWFSFNSAYQYYPVVLTSFWIERQLWGLNPFGYHLVNVLLHALNAVLLFQLCSRLQIKGAWLAALIFAVHPVHVETAAWITERKNLLSLAFYLASALLYMRWDNLPKSGLGAPAENGHRLTRKMYFGALGFFVLALLSKTVTASLPAAILLVIYWKRGRIGKRDILPLLPFFAAGLGFGLLTAWVEKHVIQAKGEEWTLGLVEKFLLAGRILWFYLSKLLWPTNLTFFYERWEINSREMWQYLYPLGWLLLLGAVWQLRRRIGRGPIVALLFFTGSLFPALGFFNVYPMRYSYVADHFQYHASLGILVLASALVARVLEIKERSSPSWSVCTGVVVLGILGTLTWKQCGMYHDLETLWRTTLHRNPTSWAAASNLSVHLDRLGRYDEALPFAEQAYELNSRDLLTQHNLANVRYRVGLVDEALRITTDVLKLRPDFAPAHRVAASSYLRKGQTSQAEPHLAAAYELEPDHPGTNRDLAILRASQNRHHDAVMHYEKALTGMPRNDALWAMAAESLMAIGETSRAIAAMELALQLAPDRADLKQRLQQLRSSTK